ncbi:hypothetical protein GLYMA_09G160800v4 [Glycine max]|nr:hypothetical protein GLYMA_09G160800v4 [Glycine max]KAH1043249.1 hypothetical protein GYH30_025210 [Glycine max]
MMFLALFGLPLAGMFLQILFSCYPSTFPERFCCQVSSMIQLAAHFKCKAFAHEFLAPLFHWPHLGGNQYFNSQSKWKDERVQKMGRLLHFWIAFEE